MKKLVISLNSFPFSDNKNKREKEMVKFSETVAKAINKNLEKKKYKKLKIISVESGKDSVVINSENFEKPLIFNFKLKKVGGKFGGLKAFPSDITNIPASLDLEFARMKKFPRGRNEGRLLGGGILDILESAPIKIEDDGIDLSVVPKSKFKVGDKVQWKKPLTNLTNPNPTHRVLEVLTREQMLFKYPGKKAISKGKSGETVFYRISPKGLGVGNLVFVAESLLKAAREY